MPTVQYWKILGSLLGKSKEKITKQCIIGDTCFMSLAKIWGNLFTRHPKNINHVHKDSNDLLSVIIILGTNVHGGEIFFYDGVNLNEIGKRSHILKHSRGRCLVGAFDIFYIKDLFVLVIELFCISLSTNKYFFTFYIMVQDFMVNI